MIEQMHTTSYSISMDKTLLNIEYIHRFLSTESYWAKNIPIETVKKSIEGSICFGVYDCEKQIGFARVITDEATFAYLADVFIDPDYRGKGLSKSLMRSIMKFIETKHLRRFMLATLDARELYKQYGFNSLKDSSRIMEIKFFEKY